MHLKLICNPRAGGGKAKNIVHQAERYFIDCHVEYDTEFTYRPGGATLLSKLASSKGYDVIVSIGGDGTANEVLNGMFACPASGGGSPSVLGIIPAGSANDFSKMLGLPVPDGRQAGKIEEACDLIINGQTKKIDIGRINERLFLNGVGIGLDAEIAKKAQENGLRLSGKDISKIEIAKIVFKFVPPKISINLDGEIYEKEILFATIGNGKSFGGGFLLTPEAEIVDGLLDVCIVSKIGKLKTLLNINKALRGKHIKLPFVTMSKSRKIIINSNEALPVHVDGEIYEGKSPYIIEIIPRSLSIKSPAEKL